MIEITYTIRDEEGIHARPAGMLVKKMQAFTSAVTIKNGEKTADGKKLFQVMKLGAKCGDTISISVDGEDESSALEAAKDILEANL